MVPCVGIHSPVALLHGSRSEQGGAVSSRPSTPGRAAESEVGARTFEPHPQATARDSPSSSAEYVTASVTANTRKRIRAPQTPCCFSSELGTRQKPRGNGVGADVEGAASCSRPLAYPGSASTPEHASARRPLHIILEPTPEDFLLHAARALGLCQDTSLQLALHVWRRVQGLVQVLISIRQPGAAAAPARGSSSAGGARRPSDAAVTQRAFAAACLWLSAKLEEQRDMVPGAGAFAAVAGSTRDGLVDAELRVLQWCAWSPRSECGALGAWGV